MKQGDGGGGGEGGALGLFLSTGRGVLRRRGEFSIQRLNLFATACSLIAKCTSTKDRAFFFKPNADTDKVSIIMNFICRLCLALRYEFVDNVHKSNQIKSTHIKPVGWFLKKGKNGVPGEKPLGAE